MSRARAILSDKSAKIFLYQVAEAASDLTEPMAAIAENLRASVDANFGAEGRYSRAGSIRGGSNKWKEVVYDAPKGTILCRSGQLRDSIVGGHNASAAWAATDMEYAAAHNYGRTWTPEPRVHEKTGKEIKRTQITLPARPFLVLQPEDIAEARALILDHLLGGSG